MEVMPFFKSSSCEGQAVVEIKQCRDQAVVEVVQVWNLSNCGG